MQGLGRPALAAMLGLGLAVALPTVMAQPPAAPAARIKIDTDRAIGEIHPHLFGNFAEHLGRMIYGGVYEEGSPLSDKDGFRKDVMDVVSDLNVSILRWPGGNFARVTTGRTASVRRINVLCGPSWRGTIWKATASARTSFSEVLRDDRRRAVHLHQSRARARLTMRGTGSSTATAPSDTYWARSAAKNGREQPWNVKYWALGNEIDGPWQLGHKNAEEYSKFALEAAKAMRCSRSTSS